jgi:hypothetical protein
MSRDSIEHLVHRYSDAVVHRDVEQWSSTWAEDAIWDLGRGRRVEGRDSIVELWFGAMDRFQAVVQTVLNGSVELDETAGTGSGRWYVHELMRRADGTNDLMVGHYDDLYVQVGNEWLFAARELTPHYQGPPDLTGTFRAVVDET